MSNFAKHLKNFHNLKSRESKTQKLKVSATSPEEQIECGYRAQNEQNDSDIIIIEEIVDVPVEVSSGHDQTNETDNKISMFTQLTQQINVMMSAVLRNSDSRKDMGFMISNSMQTLYVANIAPDGNCLFSSLVHQLFRDKIGSKLHRQKTKQLRSRVVDHILNPNNFPKYMHELKNRVFENKKKNDIENMETECKLWVPAKFAEKSFPKHIFPNIQNKIKSRNFCFPKNNFLRKKSRNIFFQNIIFFRKNFLPAGIFSRNHIS